MHRISTRFAAAVALLSAPIVPAAEPIEIRYPGTDWSVGIELPGFTVGALQGGDVRDTVTLKAFEADSGALVTVRLERAGEDEGAAQVRERRVREIRRRERIEMTRVRREARGELALLDFFVPFLDGLEVRQRHVHAFAVHRGVSIEIHLTKPRYVDADAPLFEDILDSIRVDPRDERNERTAS